MERENNSIIDEFLKKKEAWNYNFECEAGNQEFSSLETLERYFAYRASGDEPTYVHKNANIYIKDMQSKYGNVYDPDGSREEFYPLTHKIYDELWGWKPDDKCEKPEEKNKYKFGGDTMNSVQSVFDELCENEISAILSREEPILLLPERNRVTLGRMFECVQTEPNFCDVLTKLFQGTGLIEYIESYHTLGNFVLVPQGFNRDRGGKLFFSSDSYIRGYEWNKYEKRYELKVCDYWDLSLEYLKENDFMHYDKNDFSAYINYFYLWDWVKADNNDEYSVNFIGMNKMGEKRNLFEFFDKTVKMIKRRGKFMTAMLIIARNDTQLYKEIRKLLLKGVFIGINGAAGKILNEKETDLNEKKMKEPLIEKAEKLLKELAAEELDRCSY